MLPGEKQPSQPPKDQQQAEAIDNSFKDLLMGMRQDKTPKMKTVRTKVKSNQEKVSESKTSIKTLVRILVLPVMKQKSSMLQARKTLPKREKETETLSKNNTTRVIMKMT